MQLTTCLWFNGNAREAAEFYVQLFPNSRLVSNWITDADTPGNQVGDEVTVEFEIFGQKFIALNGGPQFPHTEAVSFQIPCEDQAEIDHYWNTLTADGGEESMCGWLKDKFGVSWQVTSPEMMRFIAGADKSGAERAVKAMLEMRKIVLKDLEKAYNND
ncbi:MAG: hypothetical protein RL038_1131 [Actinomycetota bacterium]|jgi:predicted 3-demethylubiquinone-9 3-methyltransferase (glyoxalase superfamily)